MSRRLSPTEIKERIAKIRKEWEEEGFLTSSNNK